MRKYRWRRWLRHILQQDKEKLKQRRAEFKGLLQEYQRKCREVDYWKKRAKKAEDEK